MTHNVKYRFQNRFPEPHKLGSSAVPLSDNLGAARTGCERTTGTRSRLEPHPDIAASPPTQPQPRPPPAGNFGGRGAPLPVDAAISDRLTGATLRRALIRAYMADELNLEEIASEFSCSVQYVKKICCPLRAMRAKVRWRENGLDQG